MPYFDEAFLTFFKELAQNNHKEWFQAHKPTYENKVKGPFYALVGEMIEKIHREDPRIHPEVKELGLSHQPGYSFLVYSPDSGLFVSVTGHATSPK